MCELDQINAMSGVNRRQFTTLGAFAAFAAACSPSSGSAASDQGLAEEMVKFAAPGGTMDAFFVHPAKGKHPAVIVWPDIAGLRDAFKAMGRRVASAGYSVIVVNPFYRSAPAPQFADFADFRDHDGFNKVRPWMAQNTPDNVMATAKAVVAWLDKQPSVDTKRGVGTQGYCMGGPFTIYSAAGVPDRVKSANSFHGAGLVGDDPKSPVNLFDDAPKTDYLICIAQNDDARAPTDKDKLRAAADAAKVQAEIEVYKGDHGWTVPDSPVYNQAEAERAWGRLMAHYAKL
jgi:carboxymethylenebutenolidase